jgi:uncharacterized protein with ParB-like and HNH nuclease domain
MDTEDKIKEIDFIPLGSLVGKHFVVKDYQRGYKWEAKEINELLNDVNNHRQGKYCLQPIVVDETNTGIELIDGQQRMTSIYLLLNYLGFIKYYTIDYQTRIATQDFLLNKLEVLKNEVNNGCIWDTFIADSEMQSYNNVDIYHIYLVFSEINKWFQNKTEEDKKQYTIKLLNQVHIIWYDIKANTNNQHAEDVFLNLNAGKIPLTSSELIKALFVLDVQSKYSKEVSKLKSAELASEWDNIENRLQDDSFWFFVCDNNYYNNLDTRIDFIIDLANEVSPKKDWDGLDSYRKYEKEFLAKSSLDWLKIKETFNKLNEWFDDKELYHFVGYLVVTRIKSLKDIIKESNGKNKLSFKTCLIEIIRKEFESQKTEVDKTIRYYELDNLDYQDYPKACQNVLLLLNVQYFLNNLSQNKFPFDLYKKESWSVEHINPQNPRAFKTISYIIIWLKSYYIYFAKYYKEKVLTKNIQEVMELLNLIEDKEKSLVEIRWSKLNIEKLDSVIIEITNELDLHGISNLALLDRNTNSKLGNKIFMHKRSIILNLYYAGKENEVFIPECTRDVFTKNYSNEAQNVSDEIFGMENMKDYKMHIKNQLITYYTAYTK